MSLRAKYEQTIRDWLAARAAGQLTQDEEADWAEKASDLWDQLSEQDQNELEAMHGRHEFEPAGAP